MLPPPMVPSVVSLMVMSFALCLVGVAGTGLSYLPVVKTAVRRDHVLPVAASRRNPATSARETRGRRGSWSSCATSIA